MIVRCPSELRRPYWPKDVGSCVAGATQASIAKAFGGKWEPYLWEAEIDGKRFESKGARLGADDGGEDLAELKDPTGKYAKGRPLKDSSIQKILRRYPKSDVDVWAHHPIWYLLAEEDAAPKAVDFALNYLRGRKRYLVWTESTEMPWTGYLRTEVTTECIRSMARVKNVQGFTGVLALTKEARARRQLRLMVVGGIELLRMFPHVVANCPNLYSRWPTIKRILVSQIWKPPSGISNSHPWVAFNVDQIDNHVEDAVRRNPSRHKLPPERIVC